MLYRQLGDGTTTDRTTPVRVLQSIGGAVSDVKRFASGHSHNILLKGDGSVWATGYKCTVVRVQIGDLSGPQPTNPIEVLDSSGEPLSSVKDISAGWAHSLFLMKDGTVQAWAVEMIMANWEDGPSVHRKFPRV